VPNTRRKYTAGQWVFICIPKLGLLHWHPFTISSSARDEKMTLHFDCSGRWTGEVAKLAEQQSQVKVSSASACHRGWQLAAHMMVKARHSQHRRSKFSPTMHELLVEHISDMAHMLQQ
jgi:hypothetical protein